MLNKKVIIRGSNSGVHFGTLKKENGTEVTLKNARRLWYWKAKKGHTLNAVAVHGIATDSKIPCAVKKIKIKDCCEIIECSAAAAKSIKEQAEHEQ